MQSNILKTFFVTICASFLFAPALSQAAVYKVTPRVISEDVKARDIITETITLENNASHKVSVFISVNAIEASEGGDITEFIPASVSDNTDSVTSWIEVTRAVLELAPYEVREIPVTMRVHSQAKPGEYHALIGFGTGRNRDVAEQQVRDGNAPGVIVSLAVDQNQTEFLKLGRFVVDRFVIKEENDAISYTLTNPGESTIVPTGEIILYNMRGAEVGSVTVNPDRQPLPTGQSTTITAPMPTDGMFGKYKAMLTVDYGSAQPASVYDTAFFYAISWAKLAWIFAILLIVGIGLVIFLHRRVGIEADDDDVVHLPLIQRELTSAIQDHDINLKKDK